MSWPTSTPTASSAPQPKGIIHLGATSCYVGDNTDLIILYDALRLVLKKLVNVVAQLERVCLEETRGPPPPVSFTPVLTAHGGQSAPPCGSQELLMDIGGGWSIVCKTPLLGCKGTTGHPGQLLELSGGDHVKCRELDRRIAEKDGVRLPASRCRARPIPASRIPPFWPPLSGIAQSAAKFSNDIRLLQHLKGDRGAI